MGAEAEVAEWARRVKALEAARRQEAEEVAKMSQAQRLAIDKYKREVQHLQEELECTSGRVRSRARVLGLVVPA